MVPVVEDPLGEPAHRRSPGRGEQVLTDHRLDHGLDVVVVEDLERATDDGGTLLGDAVRPAGLDSQAPSRPGDVRGRQLLLDHLLGEEIGLHEFAQRGTDLVLAAGDNRGMRDLDSHGVLEQGRDREPVGEGADHAALGRGADVFEPGVLLLEGERDDEDDGHDDQERQGQELHPAQRRGLLRVAVRRGPSGGAVLRGVARKSRGTGQRGRLSVNLHEPSLDLPGNRPSANVAP